MDWIGQRMSKLNFMKIKNLTQSVILCFMLIVTRDITSPGNKSFDIHYSENVHK